MIHVARRATGLDAHCPRGRVDANAAQRGEIDHEPVVAGSEPWPVVGAAPDGQQQVIVASEMHGGDHVGDIRAAHDEPGVTVDHAVVDATGLIVIGVLGRDQATTQTAPEISNSSVVEHRNLLSSGVLDRS